ncbi:MAG: hypothetical protein AAF702_27740 [Chloroflexota bacterium]
MNAPSYVNSLNQLEWGQTYWISVTEAALLEFPDSSSDDLQAANTFGNPPTTYYGNILSTDTFTPAPGLTVSAFVGQTLCGRTTTQEFDGNVVYVITIYEADGGRWQGCGQQGASVRLEIGEELGEMVVPWRSRAVEEIGLQITQ